VASAIDRVLQWVASCGVISNSPSRRTHLGRLRVWGGLANALAIGLFIAATASALSRLRRYERIARPVTGSGRT